MKIRAIRVPLVIRVIRVPLVIHVIRVPLIRSRRDPRSLIDPRHPRWGIVQKQTGADRLSLGGALVVQRARARPDAQTDRRSGRVVRPARSDGQRADVLSPAEHPDLFRLAIGGYGLFGIITRVRLRLRPRVKVERVVTLGETSDIIERFEQRIRDGYLYGDFQFATDDDARQLSAARCLLVLSAGGSTTRRSPRTRPGSIPTTGRG